MREILFRGKRVDTGEWAYSRCPDATIMAGMLHWDFTPETVGQYTGLTDKNGKKIFEGDVVTMNSPRYKYSVKWKYGGFQFEAIGFYEYPFFGSHADKCEVVGNIHDNPELLEEMKP